MSWKMKVNYYDKTSIVVGGKNSEFSYNLYDILAELDSIREDCEEKDIKSITIKREN